MWAGPMVATMAGRWVCEMVDLRAGSSVWKKAGCWAVRWVEPMADQWAIWMAALTVALLALQTVVLRAAWWGDWWAVPTVSRRVAPRADLWDDLWVVPKAAEKAGSWVVLWGVKLVDHWVSWLDKTMAGQTVE